MPCLACFLDDDFQEQLRSISQTKVERFETTLSDFKTNFLKEFSFLKTVFDCPVHKKFGQETQRYISQFHNKLKDDKTAEVFFDSMINIYVSWISGSTVEASNLLFKLLNENGLLNSDSNHDFENRIFFRGRAMDTYPTIEDLYHIPFNKRFKIANQRYSLTGQPLLYLGLSPLDVLIELRKNIDQYKEIYYCSFVYSSDEKLKIFKLTNGFTKDFIENNIIEMEGREPPKLKYQVSDYLRFILISICSFRRSRVSDISVFSEEYVLPQLITSILRQESFNGISFLSTRFPKDLCESGADFHVNMHKGNLALFTTYDPDQNYDKKLSRDFIISKPICYTDIEIIPMEEINRIRIQIMEIVKQRRNYLPRIFYEELGFYTESCLEKMKIKSNGQLTEYFNHPVGVVHKYLLYQAVINVRNRL